MNALFNIIDSLKSVIQQNHWLVPAGLISIIVILVFTSVIAILKKRKPKDKKTINIEITQGNITDSNLEESYKLLVERIKREGKRYKSILFTSAEKDALPITIPVNAATGLSNDKKRCLLIDLDFRRNAIAKVFEIDTEKCFFNSKAIKTGFENLWVLPGNYFARQMDIKAIVQNAADNFDFILINAPFLHCSPDRKQILSSANAAFICTKNDSHTAKLIELINSSDCKIIGNIQIRL